MAALEPAAEVRKTRTASERGQESQENKKNIEIVTGLRSETKGQNVEWNRGRAYRGRAHRGRAYRVK